MDLCLGYIPLGYILAPQAHPSHYVKKKEKIIPAYVTVSYTDTPTIW